MPAAAGIVRVDLGSGPPYVGKTADVRRRMQRLLSPRQSASRRLTLRDVAKGVHYLPTGSPFESGLLLYRAMRLYRPDSFREHLKLRPPPFLKILLGNRFPRTCVTRRLARSRAVFYGPFRTRNEAKQFEGTVLDLFQARRCTENLTPSPSHPGCIWGDMRVCLRPCQQACDDDTYRREVARLEDFLATEGQSFVQEAERARDCASNSMEFEAAGRHHRLLLKARAALRLKGPLARELGALCGMVFQCGVEARSLEITPLYKGSFQDSIHLRWDGEPRPASLGAAIRQELATRSWQESGVREKEEHLALLQRWHGSSFRKGEFIPFASMAAAPVRKLANAAMRVATG